MSITRLLDDYGFLYLKDQGHKHARPGWINIQDCPFCQGNVGYHLGFNYQKGYFNCWRCGPKGTIRTLAHLLHVSPQDAIKLAQAYDIYKKPAKPVDAGSDVGQKPHELPTDVGVMGKRHKHYLITRGFDPTYLQREWGVMGTGPMSILDDVNYSHRILAPVWWGGRQVSFQARDVTGHQPLKYMACPKAREVYHHKRILYGKPWNWMGTGICVEGIFDVWRLGPIAFCTFGIEYTPAQLYQIKQNFNNVVILFDDDPQAIAKAKEMQFTLQELGMPGTVAIEFITGDPAALPQQEANYIVSNILKHINNK